MNTMNISDQVVEGLSLSQAEAVEQDTHFRGMGARLLFGAWYVDPDKERITDDLSRYIDHRNLVDNTRAYIGRAVIQSSSMIGVGIWELPGGQ